MDQDSASIGMFDSGIGGLTVMKEIMRTLPHEEIVYFGDTARLPYGEKSKLTIINYSYDNAQFLIEKNIKILVIACNTATAHAIHHLQERLPLPILGTILPGAKRAVDATKNGRIAVLGTKGTVRSGEYAREIVRLLPSAQVFSLACPLLVPLIEENWMGHAATRMILSEYLLPLKREKVDTLLLGCTHYPLLENIIREQVGEEVTIVDSASSCAEEVARTLRQQGLNRKSKSSPTHRYYVSDDPEKFRQLGKQFLGRDLEEVRLRE